MTITKEEFFKPGKMSAQDKALATDHAAKRIVETEAALRAQKTERLRLLREAQEPEVVPPHSELGKKASKPGRA